MFIDGVNTDTVLWCFSLPFMLCMFKFNIFSRNTINILLHKLNVVNFDIFKKIYVCNFNFNNFSIHTIITPNLPNSFAHYQMSFCLAFVSSDFTKMKPKNVSGFEYLWKTEKHFRIYTKYFKKTQKHFWIYTKYFTNVSGFGNGSNKLLLGFVHLHLLNQICKTHR